MNKNPRTIANEGDKKRLIVLLTLLPSQNHPREKRNAKESVQKKKKGHTGSLHPSAHDVATAWERLAPCRNEPKKKGKNAPYQTSNVSCTGYVTGEVQETVGGPNLTRGT